MFKVMGFNHAMPEGFQPYVAAELLAHVMRPDRRRPIHKHMFRHGEHPVVGWSGHPPKTDLIP